MPLDLINRTALVADASRGIGAAIAVALAAAGARVAINYRERTAAAETVAAAIIAAGGQATTVQADVSNGDAVAAMVETIGPTDILIDNAGIALIRGIDELTEADCDQTIAVNTNRL